MSYRILVVDDSALVRRVVNLAVTHTLSDVQIQEASTLDDALSSFKKYVPDIIISDFSLKDADTTELFIQARNHPKKPRIIVYSAGLPSLTDRLVDSHIIKGDISGLKNALFYEEIDSQFYRNRLFTDSENYFNELRLKQRLREGKIRVL